MMASGNSPRTYQGKVTDVLFWAILPNGQEPFVRDNSLETVMMQEGWEETVASTTARPELTGGVGCLLQIHPLDISGNLKELTEPQTTIGREPNCGLCITDSSVSRQHAIVERNGDEYHVTDLGSTNGTCVNEKQVTSTGLSPGDRVQFGSYIFKFLSTNHIEMQYHEAVYSMMTCDGLTGILNKRLFLDIIGREFQRAATRGMALSLILFDIDHFKSINDTHGHLAGDEVLQELAHRVSQIVARHDVFARYGGEEFAILMSDVETAEAVELAEECRLMVESTPFPTCAGLLPVTISIGVADMTAVSEETDESLLIRASDKKLYEAKRAGRNRICC